MTNEPTTDSLENGSTIGPWRLERQAGNGAYGMVYKVRRADSPASVPLALKLALSPNDRRLLREGELLARFHHPSVPQLVDRGVWHSSEGLAYPYLVMQWIEGLPLYRWARVHEATSRQVLQVLEQVASALAEVHAAGCLHRDVKGDNILVEPGGRAFLTDFGAGTWAEASPLTETVLPPGTRGYRGPEALRFQRLHAGQHHEHYVARSFDDLYSLGVTGYRVVTGVHPPPGTEPEAGTTLHRPALYARPPPQACNPSVAPELAALIERLLASEPEARGSAKEGAQAARAAAEQAGPEADVPLAAATKASPVPVAAPPPAPARAEPAAQRTPPWRMLASVALAALMVALAMRFSSPELPGHSSRWVQAEDLEEEAERLREISVADASVSVRVEQEALNSGPLSVAKKVPAEPMEGQRRGPCEVREVEIRGGCWAQWGTFTPPCGDDAYEWNGKCYLPRFEHGRPPTSNKKKQ